MRIGKRIFSIIIVACITVTTVFMDMPLVSFAAETENPEELMTPDDTMALAGDESNITVSEVTTASTYYSAYYSEYDAKHPMYIEYTTTSVLTNEERNYIKMEITKEDGTNVCTQPSDISHNSFSIIDCMNVENGNTYNLIFTITYNKTGEEKTLWSEKRTVSFEEKKEWASCNYFPTGEKYYNCELYIPKDKIIGSNMLDEVYLFDTDGNIAAKSVRTMQLSEVNYVAGSEDPRYIGVFSNTPAFIEDMDMYKGYCSFYCTRKLEEYEKLYVGYSLNGTICKLKDVVLTVTSKPYITSISYLPRDFQGNLYYDFIGINDIYAGADNASVIDLSAYNIDFSKLSIELQDKDTKETAGVSAAYMQLTRDYAFYNIQWQDGKEPKGLSSYNVVYNYNGSGTSFVTDGNALSCYTSSKSENIIWNPMEDSIEYYNKDMPSGSLVSYEVKNSNSSTSVTYASGECTVNNSHLITVPLQEISSDVGSCYLTVIYTDNEGIKKTAEPRSVSVDTTRTGAFIYSCYLTKQVYLPIDGDIEFSIEIHCKDKSKLPDKCTAYIYNDNVGGNTAETDLMLENENGRLVYKGICAGLDAGAYNLSFTPYGKNQLRFSFFVLESDRLCLKNQSNNLDSGKVSIYFASAETAEWYCGERNFKIQDNLKVKILDTQENEIGTYTHKDFIITGEDFYRDIQFTEDVMKQLASINYCYVYLYYGDGSEEDTIAIYSYDPVSDQINNFYDKELLYENGVYASGDKENRWMWLGTSGNDAWTDEWIMNPGFLYGKCNSIYGTKSTFPAVITITDWYSMEVIKKITVNEPGHIFTESELEGLLPTKLYDCYLQGADGTAEEYLCYLGEYDIVPDDKEEENNPGTGDNKNEEDSNDGEDNKADEEDKINGDKTDNDKTDNEDKTDEDTGNDNPEIPETKPTKTPNVWYGWVGTSGENSSIEPTIKPEETPYPSQTPEPSPSPGPTPKVTIKPEVTAIPENTAEPVPTLQPEASIPPLDNNEPDKTDNSKWNTIDSINKWELSLKKKKIKLKKGQKAKIRIISELNTKVVYKSLKPSVATVNKNGVVTAKKPGKAIITVKANGKVCKVTVTVTTKETVKENIKIPAGAYVVKLNKDFKLTETKATIKKGKRIVIQKADGIPGKVTFISLDKKIASVSVNGVIKAKKKGKTTILIKKGNKTIKLKITVKK